MSVKLLVQVVVVVVIPILGLSRRKLREVAYTGQQGRVTSSQKFLADAKFT